LQGKNGCSAGFVVDAGVDLHAARHPILISKSVQIVLLWPLTRVSICCKDLLQNSIAGSISACTGTR
jgi:hypothetical protein